MELHMLSPTSQCSWPTLQRCWPRSPGHCWTPRPFCPKRWRIKVSKYLKWTCLVSFGLNESLCCDIYRKSEICVLLPLFRAFFRDPVDCFGSPFFRPKVIGNPKSEGSTRLVDSYDLCFFPFATSHPFREETRGKSPGLHQVGSIRYQASGSVIAIRPYGKISRSQPGNWKKGSNLSFTQLFLIFGVRLIEVSYICIVVFIFFWSFCCSNSVDMPKRITSFFWSAQTWFGKPLKCHTSGSLACLWLFLCRTTHRPNHHSCTPATVNANKSPCSVTVSWCDMLEFMITKFYVVWKPDFDCI